MRTGECGFAYVSNDEEDSDSAAPYSRTAQSPPSIVGGYRIVFHADTSPAWCACEDHLARIGTMNSYDNIAFAKNSALLPI